MAFPLQGVLSDGDRSQNLQGPTGEPGFLVPAVDADSIRKGLPHGVFPELVMTLGKNQEIVKSIELVIERLAPKSGNIIASSILRVSQETMKRHVLLYGRGRRHFWSLSCSGRSIAFW